MKTKTLFILSSVLVLLVFYVNFSYAIDWHTANQKTIAWDANTSADINAGDAIAYSVYLRNINTNAVSFVAETAELSILITFITEGQFHAGVATVRKVDLNLDGVWDESDVDENGIPLILESDVTWSNSTDIEAVPVPFGLRYFVTPDRTKGLVVR